MTIKTKRSCPTCKKTINDSHDQSSQPFCSERCKSIDFGDWIDGRYSIPSEDSASEQDLFMPGTDPH